METDSTVNGAESPFDRVVTTVALGLYVAMIVVVGIQIAARWIFQPYFGESLPWTVNLSQFLLVYVTFVGAAVASAKREHISLDLLVSRLSERSLRVLFAVRTLLAFAFVAVMVRGAYPLFLDNQERTIGALPNHAPFTRAWLYVPVIVGGVLILVYGLRDLREAIADPQSVLADLKREETDD